MARMTRKEKKAAEARRLAIREAVQDEHIRFNAAIRNGKIAILETHSGSYQVKYVDSEWWYHTGAGLNSFSWCGCNDGTWAGLMAQVGEARHSHFA